MTARTCNATIERINDPIQPLVNPQTNAQIANFPTSLTEVGQLNCKSYSSSDIRIIPLTCVSLGPEKRALGISLGMRDPGQSPNTATKARFFTQLRLTIGLHPNVAV